MKKFSTIVCLFLGIMQIEALNFEFTNPTDDRVRIAVYSIQNGVRATIGSIDISPQSSGQISLDQRILLDAMPIRSSVQPSGLQSVPLTGTHHFTITENEGRVVLTENK